MAKLLRPELVIYDNRLEYRIVLSLFLGQYFWEVIVEVMVRKKTVGMNTYQL